MAEYIEREALLKVRPFTVAGGPVGDYTEGFLACVEEARNAIMGFPSADVEPVRHGTWIHDGPNFHGGVDWCHCSECQSLEVWAAKTPYCARCGAEMENGRR